MNKIKFSHYYHKLHGQTSAELLAVRHITIDAHTPLALLEYDTTYDGGQYPLNHGKYLQLIFLGNLRIPFYTIRSAYPASKVDYYFSKIGEKFEIITPEEPSCSQCRHFCGFSQMEIDYDTGDTMESVRCDVQVFATPDYAKNCPYRQLKVVQK